MLLLDYFKKISIMILLNPSLKYFIENSALIYSSIKIAKNLASKIEEYYNIYTDANIIINILEDI